MRKEIISFRIDLDVLKVLMEIKEKTGLSFSNVFRMAIIEFLKKYNSDDKELNKKLEELKQRIKREEARERNKEKLKGLTLVHNQYKLIKKLKKQGLKKEILEKYIEALEEEAKEWGLTNKEIKSILEDGVEIYEY